MVISRPVRMCSKWIVAALFASGCQFSGADGEDTDTDAETETGGEAAGVTTNDAAGVTSGSPTSDSDSDSNPTTDVGDSSDSDPTTAGSTTTGPACEPFTVWIWADDVPDEDTTLTKTDAAGLPLFEEAPVVFLRATGGQGTAAFGVEIPCTDTVQMWALTWDALGGDISNADAYTIGVDVDRGEGVRWEYGCDNTEREWRWYRIRDTGERCGEGGELEPMLEAGMHHVQVTNTEAVTADPEFNFTGIAALVVTNDPSVDPIERYDPALE